MENNNSRVLSNLIWRFLERSGAQLVTFVVSIILGRILSPDDYGQIALITVFITIFNVFIDNGLGNALIQKKEADQLDFSTVFFFNFVFCLVIYISLFLCAPLIGEFYNDDSLITLTRVLGTTIIISSLKNIQQAYVSKQLMFKKFFFSTLIGTIVSAIVGIVLAKVGVGAWAIVAQHLTNAIIDTFILWITVKWRPSFKFSFDRLKGLFTYGYKLMLSALMNTLYNNFRQLVIGKYYSSSDLALYNRGQQFPQLIIQNINTSIDSILFPVMSNAQDEKIKIKQMLHKSITVSSFILWPILIGMMAIANPLISVLLTDKWIGCVPYLYFFTIMYITHPIQTANLNAIKAVGRSDIFLKLEIIETIFGLGLFILVVRVGPIWIAAMPAIASLFNVILITHFTGKMFEYGFVEQIRDIFPTLINSIIMGSFVYLETLLIKDNIFLIFYVFSGMIYYIIGAKIMKIRELNECFGILKKLLYKK